MKSGGSVWFGVDSKSFEILVESFKRKLSRVITERGRSFSSWIRFGERGLSLLLKGWRLAVKEGLKVFNNSWLEGRRSYKLQLRSNEVGRYLFCSVVSAEANHFVLIFPEGKGLPGGWNILAQKLRACEVKLPVNVGDGPKPQHDLVQKDLPLKVDNVSKDWRSVSESV